jgi:hypothetical protein
MAEETEVKTQETKPQETKSQEKPQAKKAPAAKKKRPADARRKGGPAPAKKPAAFSDSLEERFPALAAKLKKSIEDGIKQKIKEAQNDPKVKAASKKFASK